MSEADTQAGVSSGSQVAEGRPRPGILFDETRHFVEIDLSGQDFEEPGAVIDFFSELDRRIDETGRDWFFLVYDAGLRIEPAAWTTWADCSGRSRKKHGLGTARYPDPDGYGAKIGDPTRFATRAAALAALDRMVAQEHAKGYQSRLRQHAETVDPEARRRLTLHPSLDIAELDLNGMTFSSPAGVDQIFQAIDKLLGRTLQRWWLVIEAEHCRIAPEALSAFARRGRSLTEEHGLGAVRVMGKAAEAAHDPFVCTDRDAAFAAIRSARQRAHLMSA